MTAGRSSRLILANGATAPTGDSDALVLTYVEGELGQRIRAGLPSFVSDVMHLPDRILDLLEIAIYVFAADRCIPRGRKDSLEYQAWSRSLHFHIRVRDFEFWSSPETRAALSEALRFMTGDASVEFSFQPGHSTPATNLFDRPGFSLTPGSGTPVVQLFSGGIDSLCGALDNLAHTDRKVLLVSHQSNTGTTRTRRALSTVLGERYRDRIVAYEFECTLRGIRAAEETQRTRAFLYTSIAFAIASAYGATEIFVHENGVTSLNLYRREDLANARASRTTHPQTLFRMSRLFSLVSGSPFHVASPFFVHTKREVVSKLSSLAPDLLSSSVSCSRTFKTVGETTHCGCCLQCIDRRIAVYAAGAESLENRGLYTNDIIFDSSDDPEGMTAVIDYLRQAKRFSEWSLDRFEAEHLSDLAEILDCLPGESDATKTQMIWNLLRRHGQDVQFGLSRIRQLHDDVFRPLNRGSLLALISGREYLRPEIKRLADAIRGVVSTAVPEMFARHRPVDETDANRKVGALLRTHEARFRSEYPSTSFACARVVPDHSLDEAGLLIETKYIRAGTVPSKVTEGIAADLTKYPERAFILFLVYDPDHGIPSDDVFCSEIEAKGRNQVIILR
jgi:7-cyano-7-deazaguanine synthase in queuosine biosynthesis